MRTPVLLESWWKRTVLGCVALNSFTGTLTSPKLIAPLQIARAMSVLYSEHGVSASYDRGLAENSSPAARPEPRRCDPRSSIRPQSGPKSAHDARHVRVAVPRGDADRRR